MCPGAGKEAGRAGVGPAGQGEGAAEGGEGRQGRLR